MIKDGKRIRILVGEESFEALSVSLTNVLHKNRFCNLCGPTNEETFEAEATGLNKAGDEVKEDFTVCVNCVDKLEKES